MLQRVRSGTGSSAGKFCSGGKVGPISSGSNPLQHGHLRLCFFHCAIHLSWKVCEHVGTMYKSPCSVSISSKQMEQSMSLSSGRYKTSLVTPTVVSILILVTIF